MKFMKKVEDMGNKKRLDLLNYKENICEEVTLESCKVSIALKTNEMDIQSVEMSGGDEGQYLQEIVIYLCRLSQNLPVDPLYFKNQVDITQHMRQILLGWMIDAHQKYKLQPQTLFIAVHIIDAYLNVVALSRTKLQLLGITALWIASKFQETYQVPKIDNWIYICNFAYNKSEILSMESFIFQLINFNILLTTQLHYFNIINHICNFEQKDYFLCRYILQMCLFGIHFKKFTSKLLACSVVYFVRKLRKYKIIWSQREQELFNVFQEDIKKCVKDIYIFWQYAQNIDTFNSLRNKFKSPFYREVSKIKIGEKHHNKSIQQCKS